MDLRRADHRAGERQAPGIDVEHGHDGQDDVRLQDADRPGCLPETVKDDRAVRIHDTLRSAGRPGRVAHRGGLALVELWIRERVRVRTGEELLVADGARGRLSAVLDHDDVLDPHVGAELVEQRQERVVDDEHAVLGVVHDVREVTRMQTRVDGMQDVARERYSEVRLEMLVLVPAESRDAVTTPQAELLERDRELLRAGYEGRVRIPVESLVWPAGDDRLVPKESLRSSEDERERQRVFHHQT